MARQDDFFERRDFGWLVGMSVVFFALVAIGVWQEYSTQWWPYQKGFRKVLVQAGQLAEARKLHPGIKQIWVPEIAVVDRCVTCHLGYDFGSVVPAGLGQPLTPHPQLPFMANHPFEKFGCTPCHGGQGWAITAMAAHQGGPGWDEPMLSRTLASSCGVSEGELIQIRCNFCHRHDESTPGMDKINLAKQLIKKYKCMICHTVEGHGGHSAPELTYEGDREPDLFDFTHVTGPRTVFNWQVQHLIAAGTVWPGTAMPDFHMPVPHAQALTLMMLSWKKLNYPPQYIPPQYIPPPPAPGGN